MTALTDISLTTIDGNKTTLGEFTGKVCLVVNVASKCGLTPQYEGLEALYRQYASDGLVVLGFPANDFAGQEPGTDEEIREFCSTSYDVTFPMFSKIQVTGEAKHPLYAALTSAAPSTSNSDQAMRSRLEGHGLSPTSPPEVLWNFEKFLIGRDGRVIARFAPDTTPDNPELAAALESALAS
ncbi:glutathione peroxidase [Haliea sp. E17]|uniref:glutathione peroxidase n=1 Tax=Haliea sp. E17 TaxID=3401576 RepID=UPI003AABCEF5